MDDLQFRRRSAFSLVDEMFVQVRPSNSDWLDAFCRRNKADALTRYLQSAHRSVTATHILEHTASGPIFVLDAAPTAIIAVVGSIHLSVVWGNVASISTS